MKKTLLSILILFTFTESSFALVPILTQANSAPAVGDVLIMVGADTSILEGPSGASQTWVFNNLSMDSNIYTSTGVTVASTTYGSSFPNANMAVTDGNGNYEFLNSTSTALIQYGTASGAQIINYTPGINYMTFPFTFNSSCGTPNFTGTHAQGTLTGSILSTGDAHGSLTINGHNFPSVLRVKVVQDMDYNYTGIGHLISHLVSFIWYDGINKTPILEIETGDYSGLAPGHSKLVNVSSAISGINDINSAKINLAVFPNPTVNEVNIDFSLQRSAEVSIRIYDHTGLQVMVKNLGHISPAIKREALDLSDLSSGIYLVEVVADEIKEVKRVVVER